MFAVTVDGTAKRCGDALGGGVRKLLGRRCIEPNEYRSIVRSCEPT
jgi:hypothetical protein